jgi:hypothetical protein
MKEARHAIARTSVPPWLKAKWPDVPKQAAGYVNAWLSSRTVFTGQNPREPVPGLVHSVLWTQWLKKRALTHTKRSWGPHICASAGRPSSDLILQQSVLGPCLQLWIC